MPALTTRYFRKKALLLKIETTYGVDANPSAGANAIEIRNVTFTPMQNKNVDQNIDMPYMGAQVQLPVGTECKLQFDVAVTGSGTAGVAPAYGPLLRTAGRSETINAAAVTGTAQAGSANSMTLAVGASAVDDSYKNLTLSITGGTGSGQTARIKSYAGATKVATFADTLTTPPDATSTYSILPQVVYAPVSSSFESATIYFTVDGVQHKLLGVRGDVDTKLPAAGIPVFTFKLDGVYGGIADVPVPALTMSAWKIPLPVNNVNTSGFSLHGFATNLYSLDFAGGATVVHRLDVIGVEDIQITDRKMTGNVSIQAPLIAEHDFFTEAKNVTLGSLYLQHGQTAGNIVHFDHDSVQVVDPNYEDKNGVVALKMGLRLLPSSLGNDEQIITVR